MRQDDCCVCDHSGSSTPTGGRAFCVSPTTDKVLRTLFFEQDFDVMLLLLLFPLIACLNKCFANSGRGQLGLLLDL
jgi:hypothetical protein